VRIRVVQSAGRGCFARIGPKGNIQGRRLFARTRSSRNGSVKCLFFRPLIAFAPEPPGPSGGNLAIGGMSDCQVRQEEGRTALKVTNAPVKEPARWHADK
jgi:hypothetical protein